MCTVVANDIINTKGISIPETIFILLPNITNRPTVHIMLMPIVIAGISTPDIFLKSTTSITSATANITGVKVFMSFCDIRSSSVLTIDGPARKNFFILFSVSTALSISLVSFTSSFLASGDPFATVAIIAVVSPSLDIMLLTYIGSSNIFSSKTSRTELALFLFKTSLKYGADNLSL